MATNGLTIENGVLTKCDENFRGSLIIPDGVVSIGESAFEDCDGLFYVTIPKSVTNIGESAFYNCSRLASITIPKNVTSIGRYAFSDCNSLERITLPFVGATKDGAENTHFGYIFGAPKYKLNESYIPDSLKEVNITGGTDIGEAAFYGCSGLTSVTIPDSVTRIGKHAFYDCTGLTAVYISDLAAWCGIEFGDYNANPLSYAHNLYLDEVLEDGIITHDSLASIGRYTFCNYSGLTSIDIPDGVTSIGNYVFSGCSRLTSITIPDSVTSIGDCAFKDCSGLTSITIPNSVTDIGSSAFNGCSGLTSVIIPDSVASIGDEAFSGCGGLNSIVVDEGNTAYHSSGNCLIDIKSKTLIAGCNNSVIPCDGSVTSIGRSAFA